MFDDMETISQNTALRGLDFTLESILDAALSGSASPIGRPIAMLSFALNFAIFGEESLYFKMANLIIHGINTYLVWGLVTEIGRRKPSATDSNQLNITALWIAALWAFHPLNLTPVLYVVQRMTSLSALFILLGLITYLRGRRLGGTGGNALILASLALCWPASFLSKETGILLPGYIALLEIFFKSEAGKPSGPKTPYLLPLICAVIICVMWSKWSIVSGGYSIRDFTMQERLMTQARVLWFYVYQFVWPAPSSFALFHDDTTVSKGVLMPISTLWAWLAWLMVGGLAYLKRRRYPLLLFALSWFLLSHSIESTILPLEMVFEHRNYLAFIGFLILVGAAAGPEHGQTSKTAIRTSFFAATLIVVVAVTALRANTWSDELQRTLSEVQSHPNSARANYAAATQIFERTFLRGAGNDEVYHLARKYLLRTVELDPSNKSGLLGLMYLECAAHKQLDQSALDELRKRMAVGRFTIGDQTIADGLSDLLVEGALCLTDDQAQGLLSLALSNPYADGRIRSLLFTVAMNLTVAREKSLPLVLHYAKSAVQSDPANVAFRVNLAYLYLRSGQPTQAREEAQHIFQNPIPSRLKSQVKELWRAIQETEKTNQPT